MSLEVLQGDALTVLKTLPDEMFHCVVTSPPYWGLRDYGINGQLGLESTPEAYLARMVEVFREVRRVLRGDGVCFVNMGDSYAASLGQRKTTDKAGEKQASDEGSIGAPSRYVQNLKPKDLCGMPWRLALALQADGWWLRQDIIWAKPNPMPESVTDRCTKSHEYIFLLTKSARYFWDAEAIAEESVDPVGSESRYRYAFTGRPGLVMPDGDKQHIAPEGMRQFALTRNRRSVWTIATSPFKGAHFATFPPKLVAPCILAGTSARGACPKCGAPWERVVSAEFVKLADRRPTRKAQSPGADMTDINSQNAMGYNRRETTGWRPTCECGEPSTVPCRVLDPFGGSGTVRQVALFLNRSATLIELKPEYVEMIHQRCKVAPKL